MRFLRVAKSYLRQAKARLEDALDALQEENHPYAVRLSQECVELSLKASLKLTGIEYPKVHDVSDVLLDHKDRFPHWFKAEIEFMAETSSSLAAKRELAFYGGEEEFLTPEEVISRREAVEAVEKARRVYDLCYKLLSAYLEKER